MHEDHCGCIQDIAKNSLLDKQVGRLENIVPKTSTKPASEARLGIYGISLVSDTALQARNARRNKRFEHQRVASKILKNHAVGTCCWALVEGLNEVTFSRREHTCGDTGELTYSGKLKGVQTCKSVWVCPCCNFKISMKRRNEAQDILDLASERGWHKFMVTLTMGHNRADTLAETKEILRKSKNKLSHRRIYRRLAEEGLLKGFFWAWETKWSEANGWHPHYHIDFLMEGDRNECQKRLNELKAVWIEIVRKAGRKANKHSFKVDFIEDGEEGSAKYLTKTYSENWSAADEVTGDARKISDDKMKGGHNRYHPFDFLELAQEKGGDGQFTKKARKAAKLFEEYAETMSGGRQFYVLPALRKELGLGDEKTDEEIIDEIDPEDEDLFEMAVDDWRRVRRKRADLLAIVEQPISKKEVVAQLQQAVKMNVESKVRQPSTDSFSFQSILMEKIHEQQKRSNDIRRKKEKTERA